MQEGTGDQDTGEGQDEGQRDTGKGEQVRVREASLTLTRGTRRTLRHAGPQEPGVRERHKPVPDGLQEQ